MRDRQTLWHRQTLPEREREKEKRRASERASERASKREREGGREGERETDRERERRRTIYLFCDDIKNKIIIFFKLWEATECTRARARAAK
jgi:hypothetical protein